MNMRKLALHAALVAGTLMAAPTAFAETVLITGANSGIGLEFTRQYVEKGWNIIVTHRRPETPPSLAEIAKKYDKIRIEKLDVTSEEQVHALAAKLADTPIDVLINNAGVYTIARVARRTTTIASATGARRASASSTTSSGRRSTRSTSKGTCWSPSLSTTT
jgi:NAD(P)-dependent dehydrogenase (short-subunit alcohol dehydrogenase family)